MARTPNAADPRHMHRAKAYLLSRRRGRPVAQKQESVERTEDHRASDGPSVPWDTGLLMCVVAAACFATAIGFDTSVHSSFDLSKLAILYVAALVLVVGFVTKSMACGSTLVARTPLDMPILATLVAAGLSTAFSVDRYCSLLGAYKTYEGLVQIFIFIIFYYAACRLRRSEVGVVIAVILATGLGAAVYGLLQRVGHDPLRWSISIKGRVISNFGNPVFCATYLVMAVPLGAGLLFRAARDGRLLEPRPPAREPKQRGLIVHVDLLCWLLGLGAVCLFCARVYPSIQMARSHVTGTRLIALFAFSVGLCLALGWRHIFRRRPAAWPAALGWTAAALALGCNAAFYCTRTRGAFLGLAAGLLFFPLHMGLHWVGWGRGFLGLRVAWANYRRNAAKWIIFGALVLGLNLGLNLWEETSVVQRLARVFVKAAPSSASAPRPKPKRVLVGSAYKRMLLYHTALAIVRDNPLFGVGPDAIERVAAHYWARDYQLARGRLVEVRGYENRIHNEVLDVAASQGLVGLLARLWLWLAYFRLLWTGQRKLAHGDRPVLSGLAAAWVAYVVQNVMAFPTIPISITVWSLMGCTVAWIQNNGEPERWPTRQWRFLPRGQVFAGLAVLVATFLLLLAFVQRCLVTPYRADQQYMAGKSCEGEKRWREAAVFYNMATERSPRSHVYREALNQALLYAANPRQDAAGRATSAQRADLLVQCVESSKELIRRSPWRASGHMTLGTALETLGYLFAAESKNPADQQKAAQCLRDAEKHLKKAVEVNPYSRAMRGALIDFYTRRQRWDHAEKLLVQTYHWWPKDSRSPVVIYDLVRNYLKMKQHLAAEKLLLAVQDVVRDKERARFSKVLAIVYRTQGKWAEAAEVSREALAALARERARFGDALASALKRGGAAADDLSWERLGALAQPKAKFKNADVPRRVRLSREILALRPQIVEARYQLASALAMMGKLKEAAAECDLLLEHDPDNKRGLALLKAIRARKPPPGEAASPARNTKEFNVR